MKIVTAASTMMVAMMSLSLNIFALDQYDKPKKIERPKKINGHFKPMPKRIIIDRRQKVVGRGGQVFGCRKSNVRYTWKTGHGTAKPLSVALRVQEGSQITILAKCAANNNVVLAFGVSGSANMGRNRLSVVSWKTNRVVLRVPQISGVVASSQTIRLSSFNFRPGQGNVSFTLTMITVLARKSLSFGASLLGKSFNKVLFSGVRVQSVVTNVTISANAGINVSLRSPSAITRRADWHVGNLLTQGYHVGMPSTKSAQISIFYHLSVPRGFVAGLRHHFSALEVR